MGPRSIRLHSGKEASAPTPGHDTSDDVLNTLPASPARLAVDRYLPVPLQGPPLHSLVQDAVSRVLVRRGIPASDLRAPDKQIYIAALDALRTTQATDAMMGVIAASMDARFGHRALPCYVDLLKQLSVDELALIRGLPDVGRSYPLTHVNLVLPSNHAIVVYRNVVPEDLAAACEFKDNIPQYVDNLVRLGILRVQEEDEGCRSAYRAMARLTFVRQFLSGSPHGSKIAMSPSAIALTDLGGGLRSACLD